MTLIRGLFQPKILLSLLTLALIRESIHPPSTSLHHVGSDPGCRLETAICGGLVLQADQRGPWEMREGCLHSVLQVLF